MSAREVARAARLSIDIAHERLGLGDALVVFPEGTRSRSGCLQPMLPGVTRYFDGPEAWVVPIGITGTDGLFPVGEDALHAVPMVTRIGRPMAASELRARAGDDRRLMMDTVGLAIASLLAPEHRGAYADDAGSLDDARAVLADSRGLTIRWRRGEPRGDPRRSFWFSTETGRRPGLPAAPLVTSAPPWTFSTPSETRRWFSFARSFHPDCADILVKLEWENPTGSVKDRMAQAVISRAEEDGRLKPGDTVVEYTGGSTGTSLALVCAAKGYRIRIVSSDAFSQEKLDHMAALGAELTLVPSEGGLTTKKLILDMIEAARALSREPHTYWTDQLNNHDSIAGYYSLGEEIWSQTKGEVDAFVHCVGTGGLFARSRHGAEAIQAEHQDRRRRARGVLGAAGRPARAAQDRRRRHRLHASALGAGARGRDRAGQDRRRQGHGEAPRAGGGALRGDVFRSERRRRDSGGASGWARTPRWSR